MKFGFKSRVTIPLLIKLLASGCAGVNQNAFQALPVAQSLSQVPPQMMPIPSPSSCPDPNSDSCKRKPLVATPGVVTILFTMQQIPKETAHLLLLDAIRYASPIEQPKILFMKDYNTGGEDEGDPAFIRDALLQGYDVEYGEIPPGGLAAQDLQGKDLVIVSNPGHPLSSGQTLSTLEQFKGGVILLGDDLSRGAGFKMDSLTGVKHLNNGTSLSCDGKTFAYDNLKGYNYQLRMNLSLLPNFPKTFERFEYGNDVDHVELLSSKIQVLATATAAPGTCDIGQIPVIFRYPRQDGIQP